jgi:hypothetical protein
MAEEKLVVAQLLLPSYCINIIGYVAEHSRMALACMYPNRKITAYTRKSNQSREQYGVGACKRRRIKRHNVAQCEGTIILLFFPKPVPKIKKHNHKLIPKSISTKPCISQTSSSLASHQASPSPVAFSNTVALRRSGSRP